VAGTPIVPVADEGLGNSAYLVDLGGGRALAIDVPRDLRAVRAAARQHGLKVAFAADTHLHADFLSGARGPGARAPGRGRAALTGQAAGVAGRPVVTMCGHGERAATAASVLERAGHTGVAVLTGGPPDWSAATGVTLETDA
jgi:rhodanese-related sulfurtransferase